MPDPAPPESFASQQRGRLLALIFLGAGLLILALIVPIPFQQRASSALGDLVHAPLFAITAWVALNAWQRLRPPPTSGTRWIWRRLCVVVLGAFLFGAVMELVQGVLGRSATIHDAVSNGLGAMAGGAWYASHRLGSVFRIPIRLMAPCLILLSWWSPLLELGDAVRVHWDFPLLASFETNVELTRWYEDDCKVTRVQRGVTDGNYALRLALDAAKHPAATLIDLHGDWSDANALEFDVEVPNQENPPTIRFVVKVIDQHHQNYHSDVFRKEVTLQPGGTYHVVADKEDMLSGPESRELDLANIKFVSLQVLGPEKPVVLLVDNLRVTR